MTSIHDLAAVEALCREGKIDPRQLRRLRNAFYRDCRGATAALEELPAARRDSFAAAVAMHALELVERRDSAADGATKLVFRTAPGRLIESVILRIAGAAGTRRVPSAVGRTSLCVSSQVGCAGGCRFCATGKMGVAENLSAADILDQVVRADEILAAENRRVRNVVFMGMGEPLFNEAAVYAALEVLHAPQCFNIPPRRTLVSTVGIPDALIRCARHFPAVGIAVSLHSARDEVRRRLIPLARRHPLGGLREAIREVVALQGRPVMIEYMPLAGLNDGADDADALIDYLRGILAHVNLIAYNPVDGAPELRAAEDDRREAFAAALRRAGLIVTNRRSLGRDIAAACGQLARVSSW
jgi:23S rRNA (adenine2503-C2)-methyltransferase